MNIVREFKIISQKFDSPHLSSNLSWEVRESIVLRELKQTGEYVYGEIAPVPGFPFQPSIPEILIEAEKWASNKQISNSGILAPALSCMNSEIWKMNSNQKAKRIERSDLISTSNSESRRFSLKRKIGLFPVSEEIKKIKEWFRTLDPFSKVRLDANGSLSMNELSLWSTEFSSEIRIEYIEQPVNDDFRDELFEFSRNSKLPLAIDETIVAMGSPQPAKEQGWNGFYVIKPTLLTDWSLTLKFAKENPDKTVFSTVYESPFGYEALVRACRFSNLEAGISRETLKHNNSELAGHHAEILESPAVSMSELNDLWEKLN